MIIMQQIGNLFTCLIFAILIMNYSNSVNADCSIPWQCTQCVETNDSHGSCVWCKPDALCFSSEALNSSACNNTIAPITTSSMCSQLTTGAIAAIVVLVFAFLTCCFTGIVMCIYFLRKLAT